MILPILRLVLIYFLLVAGVVAVFNRDKLAPLLPGARDRDAATGIASGEAPAPLAGVSEVASAADGAQADVTQADETQADETQADETQATGQAGTGQAGDGPVFPEPTGSDTTGTGTDDTTAAAPAPGVTPAPGIVPETAPQPTPTDSLTVPAGDAAVTAGQGDSAAPEATMNATAQPAQPAKPGSPAPLGTPIATAPEAEADPAPQTAPPVAEPAPAAPAAPTAEQTGPAAPPGEAAAAAPASGDPAALADAIGAARAAYWSGDIEAARAQMTALAAAHPDNAEVAGELGNLAFALRDYPAAAEAWHRAGLLLIDRGEGARVMSFLPFLQSIAPDKAAELAARLQDR